MFTRETTEQLSCLNLASHFRNPNAVSSDQIHPCSPPYIQSVAKKVLIHKRVHPDVMRHTFAMTLLDNGNDLRTVQSLMGHSHIRTTEAYLHSTDDRKVEAIRACNSGYDSIRRGES